MAVNISVACIVPAVLFYVALVTIGITAAVVVALMWTYGAIAWRWATKRPMSGLLILTVSVMTIRTAFTLATGDTFVYFLQPIVSDGLVAAIFLVSLATARPVVARLAADFYPIDVDVARRPRIRRLFWHLTLMWAVVGLAKGGVGLWLLQSQSLVDFVLIKNIAVISLTGAAVVVTVWASLTVARKEGLLSPV
jgi:intracellular septation protein A